MRDEALQQDVRARMQQVDDALEHAKARWHTAGSWLGSAIVPGDPQAQALAQLTQVGERVATWKTQGWALLDGGVYKPNGQERLNTWVQLGRDMLGAIDGIAQANDGATLQDIVIGTLRDTENQIEKKVTSHLGVYVGLGVVVFAAVVALRLT